MVVIKKTNAGENVEKRKHMCTIGGNVNSYRILWSFPKKLKMELSYDPILPLSINLKKTKALP